jgi:hypothetical protein
MTFDTKAMRHTARSSGFGEQEPVAWSDDAKRLLENAADELDELRTKFKSANDACNFYSDKWDAERAAHAEMREALSLEQKQHADSLNELLETRARLEAAEKLLRELHGGEEPVGVVEQIEESARGECSHNWTELLDAEMCTKCNVMRSPHATIFVLRSKFMIVTGARDRLEELLATAVAALEVFADENHVMESAYRVKVAREALAEIRGEMCTCRKEAYYPKEPPTVRTDSNCPQHG